MGLSPNHYRPLMFRDSSQHATDRPARLCTPYRGDSSPKRHDSRAMESTDRASSADPTPARAQRIQLRPHHVGIVVGLLLGAAVMLVVAALNDVAGTKVPVLSTLASAPVPDDKRPLADRKPPPATAGTCLSWKRSDAADATTVDCSRQHLFEQAGPVQLADFKPGTPIPDNQRFRTLVNERCTPLVIKYLNGKYDPDGAFRAGALKPSQKSWNSGDRTLRCGLQRFSRSGALYPIVGKVAGQDQADIRPAGTCLGIDGRFIGDPVDCSLPHAVESVGWIDLSPKFADKFPSVGDQDAYLQPACSKLAADYAGGDNALSAKKLSVLWDNLTTESWAAGTRKVGCNLAAQLPDRSGFAPVTGSVKGPVQIGDKPAPPAEARVPPGAPAPGSGTDEKASDDASDDASDEDEPRPAPSSDADKPSIAPPVPLPDRDELPRNPLDELHKPDADAPEGLPKPPTGSARGG